MIITRTPFRMSFLGGGSDFEEFYHRSPGAVLSVTINKYMYLSSHRFFHEDEIRARYFQMETVKDVNQLKHPIVREALKRFKIKGALEISSNADVPAGTGLGSSSSFTVGLLHNLYVRDHQYVTKERLAKEASHLEIVELHEPIGRQDHYAAAYGGMNIIRFHSSGVVTVEALHLKSATNELLQESLLMFYTGKQRSASSILQEHKETIHEDEKFKTLQKMVELVPSGRDALYAGDIREFGKILHESWLLKKQISQKISDSSIDALYQKALESGAMGGKILGAGGGGFLLLVCDKKDKQRLIKAMESLRRLEFSFEFEGSKVVHISDE